jgi:ribosome-associated protein
VNKVETKVTLLFDVASSTSLSEEQRDRLEEKLANRISSEGVLHVTSQRSRTRSANQRDAVHRFVDLVAEALRERPRRRRTRVPRRARRRRLEEKRRRGRLKELRSTPSESD